MLRDQQRGCIAELELLAEKDRVAALSGLVGGGYRSSSA